MADALVLGPHPDDAEFGMGGSILKLVDEGFSVAVCVFTKGEAGTYGTPSEREEEMKAAAEFGGFSLEMLDMEDCKVFDNYENRLEVARVIRKLQPSVVFAPYHTSNMDHKEGRAHPDHLAAGDLARFGARYARFSGLEDLEGEAWRVDAIAYYMVPPDVNADFFVDVSPYMDEWADLVRCHESQMSLQDGGVLEMLKDMRRGCGDAIDADYAEEFICREPDNPVIRALLE